MLNLPTEVSEACQMKTCGPPWPPGKLEITLWLLNKWRDVGTVYLAGRLLSTYSIISTLVHHHFYFWHASDTNVAIVEIFCLVEQLSK